MLIFQILRQGIADIPHGFYGEIHEATFTLTNFSKPGTA